MNYAIKDTTLTALGDAVRKHIPEYEGTISYGVHQVETSENFTSYDKLHNTFADGWKGTSNTLDSQNQYWKVISIPGAARVEYFAAWALDLNYRGDIEFYSGDARDKSLGNRDVGTVVGTVVNPTGDNTNNITYVNGWADEDTFSLGWRTPKSKNNSTFILYIEATGYDADGNELPDKDVIVTHTAMKSAMTPLKMAEEINNMQIAPTADELTLTGDCSYQFYQGRWAWFLEKYGDSITTKNISSANHMFYSNSIILTQIPFDLNMSMSQAAKMDNMFGQCRVLKEAPKILKAKPDTLESLFAHCYKLREVPDDYFDTWDWSYLDGLTSGYSGNCSKIFSYCFNLRKFPMALFQHGNPYATAGGTVWSQAFISCYRLDEVIGMPNPHYASTYTATGYSSPFNSMIENCYRLKRFTFAEMDPPNWSNQTLDFSKYIGYASSDIATSSYGGTADEKQYEVKDNDTYQALKDHPDWWSKAIEYSRYDRISAIETIHSLPDTSTTGTGNIIKFKGDAGSLTDGGAINTMVEGQIAVAAAKGWTVSFV